MQSSAQFLQPFHLHDSAMQVYRDSVSYSVDSNNDSNGFLRPLTAVARMYFIFCLCVKNSARLLRAHKGNFSSVTEMKN